MTTATTDIAIEDLPPGLGGARSVQLPATRYRQGNRTQYHINLPVAQVTSMVQRPDPSRPLPGNRQVVQSRGKNFGDYLRKNQDWVSPAIIVRVPPREVTFEVKANFEDNTAWGVLTIGIDVLTEIMLLDGQHRSLGIFIALEDVNENIRKLRDTIDRMRANGGLDSEVLRHERMLDAERDTRRRLSEEHISIDIVEVNDKAAAQMFGDINNNAKGVNLDLRTVLDQRSPVNRIAMSLIESHVLLQDRVETGQRGRIGRTSDKLIGAKGVADIVHAVLVGTGRVGARVEEELDRDLAQSTGRVARFLDVLLAAFTTYREVVSEQLSPRDLRDPESQDASMLGSVTMMRALAATYHELTKGWNGNPPMSRAEVESFFRRLEPHMSDIPVDDSDELWFPTGAFLPGATAPQARQGSIKTLVSAMCAWATDGHDQLPTDLTADDASST